MKRVRCPKCNKHITFDETRYTDGQTLVFECPDCHRQFGIRIGVSKLMSTRKEEKRLGTPTPEETEEEQDFGRILVVENVFHYRQELPLQMGDNVIGRYVHGTHANTAIETRDPSVDTTHCVINVSRNRQGELVYTLRDASTDGTGTFVGTTFLGVKDRLRIEDGTVITIGATSIILQAAAEK